jgi:protein-tyrosine-phosphatase
MAEALAKRLWPGAVIKSAGTHVTSDKPTADAVAAMRMIDLDISRHRATSADEFDLDSFQFVVFLCAQAKRELLATRFLDMEKIRDMFVEDPYGDEFVQYVRCRKQIRERLSKLRL